MENNTTSTTADAFKTKNAKARVRLATLADLDALIEMATRSFIDNTLYHYCANARVPFSEPSQNKQRKNLALFLRFLIKSSFILKHRNTVVVALGDGEGTEKIVACTLWLEPHSRINVINIPFMLRAGVLPTLRRWKWTGLKRLGIEFEDKSHKAAKEAFKKKGGKLWPEDSWFLQVAFTDPDHQGKGCLSMLIRDQLAFCSDKPYCLDASSAAARDRYAHFGFEENCPLVLGRGKVGPDGIVTEDPEKAVGLTNYSMVRWPMQSSA